MNDLESIIGVAKYAVENLLPAVENLLENLLPGIIVLSGIMMGIGLALRLAYRIIQLVESGMKVDVNTDTPTATWQKPKNDDLFAYEDDKPKRLVLNEDGEMEEWES